MPWIPGVETLIIKGFAWMAAHMGHAALAKLGAYIISHGGISAALSLALHPITLSTAAVIGGVVWTQEKANKVNSIIRAISKNKPNEAGKHLIELADILGLAIDETAGKVVELLSESYDAETVKEISGTIRDIAEEIKKYS